MKYILPLLFILLTLYANVSASNATDASIDWINTELIKNESVATNEATNTLKSCKSVTNLNIVSDMEYMNGTTLQYRGCVISGKDVDLFVSGGVDIPSENPRNLAIRVKPNGKFYFLKPGSITKTQFMHFIPETNMYLEWRNITTNNPQMLQAKDIRNAIYPDRFDAAGNPIRYAFNENDTDVDKYSFSNLNFYSVGAVTDDGKTLFSSDNGWLYKINVENGVKTVKYMPQGFINWQNKPFESNQVFPADSAGRYVYLAGNLHTLIDTAADCGQYYTTYVGYGGELYEDLAPQTNCKMRNFSGLLGSVVPRDRVVYGAAIEGQKLVLGAYDFSGSAARELRIEFLPQGMSGDDLARLDYLALGDSYSSGEGDNGIFFGEKYYRKGTDEKGPPREKCHISTRSYPYLLAKAQELKKSDWNTVACSGALVEADYYDTDEDIYFGQNGRLGGLTDDQVLQYQTAAKKDFIPGRVKQIEFVKKYKPKVITLTGTGNDADFAPILKACVSASLLDRVTEETCTYAADSRGISMLGAGISRQYDNVRSLVRALKQESPQTTIYYVGYPQFLKETDKTCGLGVSLSKQERRVFRTAVVYLNNIIKAAAESEGAVYVDIESSLGSHLLCGDDPYVTGYNADCSEAPLNWLRGKDECGESFHPRPAGHALMASTILANHPNIMQDQPCTPPRSCTKEHGIEGVEVPKLFKDAYNQDAKANRVPVRGGSELAAQKGNTDANIYAVASHVATNSKFDTYVTSNPVSLGGIWADSEGNLVIDKAVPESLPAGYHTLHAEGNDSLGKPVELWWIIRIFGKDGDVDEDGISDDVDKCVFMPTLDIDEDNDGIDDGCDSDIGGSGQWTKYTPPLNLGATTMGNSRSHNELLTASVPENSVDGSQSWIQSAVGEEGSVKLSGSRNNRASKSIISMILVGVGLLSVLSIAYTIIRKGGINGKKTTNQ